MCELFAVSSRKCIAVNKYLKKFYSNCEEHPHGWGLAIMQDNQSIVQKQPVKANQSSELTRILKEPLFVEHAFAHIRLATMGYTDSFNCHPFTRIDNSGRTWTLIHNGTIFNCEKLNKYIKIQLGETDSERVLLHIVDEVNKLQEKFERALNQEECFIIINDIIYELSKGNKLNLMIFNGESLFVHSNYKNSLYYLEYDDSLLISTRPLSDEKWNALTINQLVRIKNGEILSRGVKHENEYVVTKENFNFIMESVNPDLRENILNNFGDLNYTKEYWIN